MKSSTQPTLECAHCHQPITDKVPSDDGTKNYCCYGCKVVDQLLSEKKSILSPEGLNHQKYGYLDEPKIKASLLDFDEGKFARINMHLPAIHCSSCIFLLESLPDVEESILEVHVHFAKKQASITFKSDQIALSQLAALLDYIGYTPDFQTKLGGAKKKQNRLLIQLGIAGFFFGNTMLLAFPEYFGTSLSADKSLQVFFRYLMMGFSVPVLLYSAKDYFINATKSLRAGVLSIDLPIALGVSVLFIRSAYEVITHTGAGYFDSLTGLIFFLLIGKWYQQKTYENFTFDRDLKSFLPLAANLLLKDGSEKPISIDDLEKGDIILVRQGEVLPADGTLLQQDVQVDYSYITGESIPVQKKKGETIFAGARIRGGAAQFKISASVNHSYLSSLWSRDSFKDDSHKNSRGLTDRISQYFTPAIIFIATASAIVWSFTDVSKAVIVFTAVLIVACPCALALAEPFSSGSMMRAFGKHGFFLKNVEVIHRLQKITHIVFDKTGTLTYQDHILVHWHGDDLSFDEKLAIASIAKNAQHPLAKPLLEFLNIDEANATHATQFTEATGKGVTANVHHEIYRLGKASFLKLEEQAETTSVYVEKNGAVMGYFSFFQKAREELNELTVSLQNDYKISLLSGDNEAEKKRFQKIFGNQAELHFNQSPHQKLEHLQQLQKQNTKVLMIGDGLNDAGALQQSDVGISLCEKNVNFFPASDALLMADSFAHLPNFLALAKQNKKVTYQAFILSLAYNVVGLSFAIAGVLSPLVCAILMPVSSVSVVVFTTVANRVRVRKVMA